VELTTENFDTIIDGSKPAFVEFYAPWCGHCKKLSPDYDVVGETFAKEAVIVAKIDADMYKEIGSRFDVHGFPTLKFFPKGKPTAPVAYEGGRSIEDLVNYINEQAGTRARVKKAPSNVVDLTAQNFDSIVLNTKKHVLVEFYAPWCGHCKTLAPEYEKLANIFAADADVVIAKIDADNHKEVAGRFDVSGFPTLKWFGKDNKQDPTPYESGRDIPSFVEFINNKAGTQRRPDGKLSDMAGRVASLDDIAARFIEAGADVAALLKQAQTVVAGLKTEAEQRSGKFYVKAMEALQKDKNFVATEIARLDRMLTGAVAAAKADEFSVRKNVLAAFKA